MPETAHAKPQNAGRKTRKSHPSRTGRFFGVRGRRDRRAFRTYYCRPGHNAAMRRPSPTPYPKVTRRLADAAPTLRLSHAGAQPTPTPKP
jgi:hypothetical protein